MPVRSLTTASTFPIFIAGTVIVSGCIARYCDVERMVVWHDEVHSLLLSFGFESGTGA